MREPPLLPRALVGLDPTSLPVEDAGILVVGSGVAGLSLALAQPAGLPVLLATKGPLDQGATRYAQGGIAAVLPGRADSVEAHLADTIAAGAGLVDPTAARVLVEGAAAAIDGLLHHGTRFDRDADGPVKGGVDRGGYGSSAGGAAAGERDRYRARAGGAAGWGASGWDNTSGTGGTGELALTLEGGHGVPRILHAGGDATGREIERALVAAVRAAPHVRVAEGAFLVDLLTGASGAVVGALLLTGGRLVAVRAGAVVLASGGAGQLYEVTTNPAAATGDGIAAALRAGAAVADLEFVQFHPTALHVARDPRLLLSEALRGEGATLRDQLGDPVMAGLHPMGDLAPRDVVTRGMAARMAALGTDHLLLDATGLGARTLERRFPTIVAACRALGLDPATVPLPVSPAAHYLMGGIRTDLDGRSSLPGLYAVGEAACTGVHGANRLASNSLLEGAVFAARAGRALAADRPGAPRGHHWALPLTGATGRTTGRTTERTTEHATGRTTVARHAGAATGAPRHAVRRAMTAGCGVLRDAAGLATASGLLDAMASRAADDHRAGGIEGATAEAFETANLAQLGRVLVALAARREESRGAHHRVDAPLTSPAWRVRQAATSRPDGTLVVTSVSVPGGSPASVDRASWAGQDHWEAATGIVAAGARLNAESSD